MQYMPLIYMHENALSETAWEHCYVAEIHPVIKIAGLLTH
jgi:hypothetical protein